jgi:transcription factor SFP1
MDTVMGSGSYMGGSGPFNPASYTRHFLGSPVSFRVGSFGDRTISITPQSRIVGPLEYVSHLLLA